MPDPDAPPAQTSLFDDEVGAAPDPSSDHADASGPAPARPEDDGVTPASDEAPTAAPAGSPDAPKPGAMEVQAGRRPRSRSTFALGRTDRRSTELRVIEDADSPISGPFRVKAVVRDGELPDPGAPNGG